MTEEKFDALVKRLEPLASLRPGTYKFRVFLLALLGYVYIFSVIALVLALFAGLVLVAMSGRLGAGYIIGKAAFALLALVWIILRALWVRIPPPAGLRLTRKDAAPLFQAVDDLRKTVDAPRAHVILLTDDFNAGIWQIPRLGAFGWYKNYLTVGLPLMQAMTPGQFRAVLAHEFGHLSGTHGKFSSWIYRIRATWYRLMLQLEAREHWGSIVFTRFFEWYAPYFAAYSFVLARAQEYEADRLAAAVAGGGNIADALVSIEVVAAWLQQEFWPSVYKKADDQPQPDSTPYTQMQPLMRVGPAADQAERWLRRALLARTDSVDTHPSLPDRLSALGEEARLPGAVQQSAAEHFFSDSLGRLTEALNREWAGAISGKWRERYRYAQESQRGLRELEEKARREPLTVEEAWKRAYWTDEFLGEESALPLYRQVLDLQPNHAAALFSVGRILLSREQEEGIDHIKKAMQLNGEFTAPACQVVCSYLVDKGRQDEAKAFYEHAISKPPLFASVGKA